MYDTVRMISAIVAEFRKDGRPIEKIIISRPLEIMTCLYLQSKNPWGRIAERITIDGLNGSKLFGYPVEIDPRMDTFSVRVVYKE